MAGDPKEYGIELPLLVRESAEYQMEEDDAFSSEEVPEEPPKRKQESGKKRRARSREKDRLKERKQSEEDWNAYLNGEPLPDKEGDAEAVPERKGLNTGGIVLLILGILVAVAAVVITYLFIRFYLPLVRNGASFERLFKSMLLFIGIPWLAAIVLLTFSFTVGKRK